MCFPLPYVIRPPLPVGFYFHACLQSSHFPLFFCSLPLNAHNNLITSLLYGKHSCIDSFTEVAFTFSAIIILLFGHLKAFLLFRYDHGNIFCCITDWPKCEIKDALWCIYNDRVSFISFVLDPNMEGPKPGSISREDDEMQHWLMT